MQVTLSFTDNWGNTGGIQQFVNWSGTATTTEQFFSDANCMSLYKQRVNTGIGCLGNQSDVSLLYFTKKLFNLCNSSCILRDTTPNSTMLPHRLRNQGHYYPFLSLQYKMI